MKNGDIEFHDLTGPVLDSIANEGLRIAKGNNWRGLTIEIDVTGPPPGQETASIRCTLRDPACKEEIDEPSALMLDEAHRLQELFMRVGTPLSGVTIDWKINGDKDGKIRRTCSYRYA